MRLSANQELDSATSRRDLLVSSIIIAAIILATLAGGIIWLNRYYGEIANFYDGTVEVAYIVSESAEDGAGGARRRVRVLLDNGRRLDLRSFHPQLPVKGDRVVIAERKRLFFGFIYTYEGLVEK